MVFSFRFEWLLAIPNIPKAFPWLNFLPREFTPLYGLYLNILGSFFITALFIYRKNQVKVFSAPFFLSFTDWRCVDAGTIAAA